AGEGRAPRQGRAGERSVALRPRPVSVGLERPARGGDIVRSISLVVVGDALLDRDVVGTVQRLTPDAPVPAVHVAEERARPGGAGLAAALAARDGHDVTLVTAIAGDPAGAELRELLSRTGVDVIDLGRDGRTEEKVRIRSAGAGGRSLLRLDRADGLRHRI